MSEEIPIPERPASVILWLEDDGGHAVFYEVEPMDKYVDALQLQVEWLTKECEKTGQNLLTAIEQRDKNSQCYIDSDEKAFQLQSQVALLTEALTDALEWMKHHDPYPPAGGVYQRGHAALTQPAAKEEKCLEQALQINGYKALLSNQTTEIIQQAETIERLTESMARSRAVMVATEEERVKLNTENPQLKLQIERLTEALRKYRHQHIADLVCVEDFTNPSTPEYEAIDTRCWRCKLADAALKQPQEPAPCADCQAAARHAYSDATTPGFFYDKCEKHRAALTQPAAKDGKE